MEISAEKQQRVLTLAEGSIKTIFALCQEGKPENTGFILEHMQRLLSALIEVEFSRREIIDYFYSWQRDFEGNECIDEKLRQVFDSETDLKGEEIHHSWIDAWIENN